MLFTKAPVEFYKAETIEYLQVMLSSALSDFRKEMSTRSSGEPSTEASQPASIAKNGCSDDEEVL